MEQYCPLVGLFRMHQTKDALTLFYAIFVNDLVIKCDSSVHVGAFFLIITCSLHHVLWVAEQSQVHQLVIQAVLLFRHQTL